MFFLLISVHSFSFNLDSIPITVHSFLRHHVIHFSSYAKMNILTNDYTRGKLHTGRTDPWMTSPSPTCRSKKQVSSMLRCICTAVDHSRRQNVVSIWRANSAAPRVPIFCSYHILTSSVIRDWTDAWQHGIYLSSSKGLDEKLGVITVEFYLGPCFVQCMAKSMDL